jgi:CHAT domain-containing protein/Tfp pilus assembly protein PilF
MRYFITHFHVAMTLLAVSLSAQADLYFAGDVHNLQNNNTSQVSITLNEMDGQHFRAVGIFDNVTLFGRFNVPGERIECASGEAGTCIAFSGELELGDDDSGFPELTRTGFSFRLHLQDGRAQGGYLIAPIVPYMLKEQPGELDLRQSSAELLNAQANERVRREPQRAKAYWDRAIAWELQRDYPLAERDYRQYVKLLPNDARGPGKVGRMLLMQGKYIEAAKWAEKAIQREPSQASWQVLRGHVALMQGNAGLADQYYQRALTLVTSRRSFDEGLVHDLNQFAVSGWRAKEASAARDKAVSMFEQTAGAPHGEADIADYQGHYDEAIRLYRDALGRAEQTLGRDHLMVGRILFKLANNLARSGLYQEALQGYQRSLKIVRSHRESSDYDIVNIEVAEANLLDTLGQSAQAEPLFRAAVRDSNASRVILATDRASNMVMLAKFLNRNGRESEALQLYKSALPVLVGIMGPDHPGMATYYNDIALLNSAAGQHDEAIRYMKKAVKIDTGYYGEDSPNSAILTANLGNEYLAKQDYAAANEHLLQALDTATAWQNPDVLLYAYASLSQLMREQGRNDEAILFGKQAVNELQNLRRANTGLDKSLRQSFLKKNEAYYKDLADLLISQGRLPEAQQVLAMLKEDEYLGFIRRGESADGKDTTVNFNSTESSWTQRYAEIGNRVAAIGAELRELQKKPADQRTDADIARVKALRADMSAAMKSFNQTVQGLQHTFEQLQGERRAELAKRQVDVDQRGLVRELGHDAALVQYIVMDDALHILLTTPDAMLARKVDINSADLNQLIQRFRQVLGNPAQDPRPAGQALYQRLIAPISDDLKQSGAQMLMLSLDGALRYIPFAALYDGRDYLAEHYALAIYTEAARDRIKDAPRHDWQVAALGLSRKIEGFNPLPAVVGELHGIVQAKGEKSGVVPGVVYLDNDFTNDRLQEVLFDQYRVLHIASHFVFTAGTLEKSYLLLGDGSHLTLAQLQDGDYDLGSIELLTLSACETAVGETGADGKEVEGLGALAQKKGAKGVLATLWPVADESTGQFMRNLYREKTADQTKTKAETLRMAQLQMLKGGISGSSSGARRGAARLPGQPVAENAPAFEPPPGAPFAHPYFWAPFILMGNWL